MCMYSKMSSMYLWSFMATGLVSFCMFAKGQLLLSEFCLLQIRCMCVCMCLYVCVHISCVCTSVLHYDFYAWDQMQIKQLISFAF